MISLKKDKLKSIEVFAPASVANLGSGFDVFGMAIKGPGDVVYMEKNSGKGIRIRGISGDKGKLSKVVEENTAGVALKAYLDNFGTAQGLDLWINKKMPLGSGMGSSAASAVAAVFAANILLGSPMKKKELVRWAMEGERVASGAAHADNIAPSMLGGFTLIRSMDPFEVLELPVPSSLQILLLHPHVEVKTSDARAVLPENITLKSAIHQWANTAALVAALYESDIELLGRAMEDIIIEPARKSLMPYFDAVKNAANENGASGFSISGAGPSMLALCDGKSKAVKIGKAMQNIFISHKLKSDLYNTSVDKKGARIISKK